MNYLTYVKRLSVLAGLVTLFLAGGCATDSASGKKLARYRPETTNRSPWLWNNTDATGSTVRLSPASTNPEPAIVKIGTPPPGSSGLLNRVLKRGDKVVICLRDIPKPDEIKAEIDANGGVNLPLIGTIKVEGRTTAEAIDLIEKTYIEENFYRKISVIVMAEEDEYFVMGEVKREGRYPLSRDLTLLQAIVTAGGYTDYAKKSKIEIIRGKEVNVFNGVRIEERKDKDPLIQPGDVVRVPRTIIAGSW